MIRRFSTTTIMPAACLVAWSSGSFHGSDQVGGTPTNAGPANSLSCKLNSRPGHHWRAAGTGSICSSSHKSSCGKCLRIQVSFCLFAAGSRKRTPTPPPFSAMNVMPAASNAERSFSTVDILASFPVSNRFTVLGPTFAARARSVVLHSRAARAIRH